MSAKSKLAALKRYGSAAASEDKTKKKRRKVNNLKSSREDAREASEERKRVNTAWEDAEGEDERPVVVDESTGAVIASHMLGTWGNVGRNSDISPPQEQRVGSPSPPRRPRTDSPSPQRRPRADSPSPPRSTAAGSTLGPNSTKRSERSGSQSSPHRGRAANAATASPPPPASSSEDEAEDAAGGGKAASTKRAKTSSGHTAGLVSAKDFIAEDRALKAKQMAAVAKAAGAGGGAAGAEQETVYRDKRGRKLDMLNQMMRQQAIAEGKAVAEEKEAFEWGKGTAQKNLEAAHAQELANIKLEPFARAKDDAKMDQMYRDKIHADDPMAQYVLKQKDKQHAEQVKAVVAAGGAAPKPKYKGPTPRPNRFGIMPGYRWDGRDRGTGWEEKVLGQAASKQRSKDASYQWSVSDM